MPSVGEFWFPTGREAREYAAKLRVQSAGDAMLVKVEPSPYKKGYVVKALPAEFLLEFMSDGAPPPRMLKRRRTYA